MIFEQFIRHGASNFCLGFPVFFFPSQIPMGKPILGYSPSRCGFISWGKMQVFFLHKSRPSSVIPVCERFFRKFSNEKESIPEFITWIWQALKLRSKISPLSSPQFRKWLYLAFWGIQGQLKATSPSTSSFEWMSTADSLSFSFFFFILFFSFLK